MIYIAILSNSTESLQNRATTAPLFIGPYAAATVRRFSKKALARYQVILLGEQRHLRCEQLAQGWPRPESNPQPFDHESDTLPLHHQAMVLPMRVLEGGGFIYEGTGGMVLPMRVSGVSCVTYECVGCMVLELVDRNEVESNGWQVLQTCVVLVTQRHFRLRRECHLIVVVE